MTVWGTPYLLKDICSACLHKPYPGARGVNLIIKLHKRTNFLFNCFSNEQSELWASWKSTVWVLSGTGCLLVSLFFLVEDDSWDLALTSFSCRKEFPFVYIIWSDLLRAKKYISVTHLNKYYWIMIFLFYSQFKINTYTSSSLSLLPLQIALKRSWKIILPASLRLNIRVLLRKPLLLHNHTFLY